LGTVSGAPLMRPLLPTASRRRRGWAFRRRWGEFMEGQGKGEEQPGGTGWRREVLWQSHGNGAGGAPSRGAAVTCDAIARRFTINTRHDGLWISVEDLGRLTVARHAGVSLAAGSRVGVWVLCPARLAAWARHTQESRTTGAPRSRLGPQRRRLSHPYAGPGFGRHVDAMPRTRARARRLCSSTSPFVFISWSRFRNYKTPKIVNKLENLQKQKL
jgi:hypothetical protein